MVFCYWAGPPGGGIGIEIGVGVRGVQNRSNWF